jgi:hypothetical protein
LSYFTGSFLIAIAHNNSSSCLSKQLSNTSPNPITSTGYNRDMAFKSESIQPSVIHNFFFSFDIAKLI